MLVHRIGGSDLGGAMLKGSGDNPSAYPLNTPLNAALEPPFATLRTLLLVHPHPSSPHPHILFPALVQSSSSSFLALPRPNRPVLPFAHPVAPSSLFELSLYKGTKFDTRILNFFSDKDSAYLLGLYKLTTLLSLL